MQLQEDREDDIRWSWMADGEYTAKSAYWIQFQETFSKLKLLLIWKKAKEEPKSHFFTWTLQHRKILTANNLIKCNWPNDPICKLCGTDPETPTHLYKDCVFSKQVWSEIKQWLGLSVIDTVPMTRSIHTYWRKCHPAKMDLQGPKAFSFGAKVDKEQRKVFDGIMIYFWWNVWKKHKRRTFQNKSMQPRQVAILCKEDLEQYQLASRNNGGVQQS
jgi:hypothetical protein